MLIEVKLPQVSEEHNESVIVFWHVSEGDTVKKNDVIVEVQTEKAVNEIEAPEDGIIKEIVKKRADVAAVGDILVTIETTETNLKNQQHETISEEINVIATPRIKKRAKELGLNWREMKPSKANRKLTEEDLLNAVKRIKTNPVEKSDKHTYRAAPSVRKFARENNVNLEDVTPTGIGGRIVIEDVKKAIEATTVVKKEKNEHRIPLTGIRNVIAKAMVHSKTAIPHVTHFDEVNVDALVKHRTKFKKHAEIQGIKLTYLAYIVKALTLTLKSYPLLNASLDGETNEIVLKEGYHIGIAIDTENGLLVPVIKNADKKSLFTIANEISELSDKARTGKLKMTEMKGATCTISNIGSEKGAWFTPIINYPEASIIGIGRIDKKPIVVNDQITIGSMMPLSLSYDHRLIDGALAQKALNNLKEFISDPDLLFIDLIK
ncbi:2-oxo acid dehydrogenase subunit E2 [Bacillus aquiflavi]|uniref:Dihydrolipoamide acetyltransferase component of pyruvate dehydrogenase complex n=1 Tax=Bacillus aquiflavi TaxID=2672567 RepID=A0A6B3W3Y3_9BACI|nr:dihydrolipoamide acetyltransferase family protein [Bacillus aquiflavi]MBA4536967.1 2-oxo acid dehydrogenase subunit E2 [Bacillus aquiflavi]NEY82663.1 2-oxo acid dehydrogenase subunit E2 [Bacillus aquiflavi]UAC47782.1 2-oxo acid dehydrogenase subunit E2 [Bacillus aquiflavi]